MTTSTDVPAPYPVALNGVPFLVDTASEAHRHVSVPVIKQQSDTSENVGEHSINPAGLWRRSIESWHRGAGQTYYDRADSDPARFRASKGVDVWTEGQLSLIKKTEPVIGATCSAHTMGIAVTSTRMFIVCDTAIKYVDSPSASMSTMTGTKNWASITSDGYNVWATDGSDVYNWIRTDTSVGSAWNTLDCTLIKWVKGRLMASKDSAVYNITSSSAPAAMTVATGSISTDWEWVDFAAGNSCIYGAGYQGDKSLIFRSTIKSDATGLDVWVQAGELPDGEIVRAIYGYLGFVLIGTDNGVRLATADSTGNLTIGALIATGHPTRCFEGQGRFVYFGWDDYDATNAGLGRIDLTQFIGTAPAYASDLMASNSSSNYTGDVLAVVTFQGKRVFSMDRTDVTGCAAFYETASTYVKNGTIDTGVMAFGIPENKIATRVEVRHAALVVADDEALSVAISANGVRPFTSLGYNQTNATTGAEFDAAQSTSESCELRLTIFSDVVGANFYPSLA